MFVLSHSGQTVTASVFRLLCCVLLLHLSRRILIHDAWASACLSCFLPCHSWEILVASCRICASCLYEGFRSRCGIHYSGLLDIGAIENFFDLGRWMICQKKTQAQAKTRRQRHGQTEWVDDCEKEEMTMQDFCSHFARTNLCSFLLSS